ncbi:MAG: FitA-like ribbon-helix-helix domain-containing protein [Gemmatimonadota bacterium]
MSKMIQVRNVPESLHRELVERARARGQSLTAYIQEILEREVARPPAREVFDRLRGREPVDLGAPANQLLRRERDRREDA